MKNARFVPSESTSTAPAVRLFGFGEWSVGARRPPAPAGFFAVLDVDVEALPPPEPLFETRITTTITAAAIAASTSAPPTRELGRACAPPTAAPAAAASAGAEEQLIDGLRREPARLRGWRAVFPAARAPPSAASSAAIVCAHARAGSEPLRYVRVLRRSATPGCWPSR